ncbi:arylesterase [Muriicola sp.]|uniref:arylesterase n=1 Tax=Muriicola sp. TaxID=2020856 RepID=UPI003C792D4B
MIPSSIRTVLKFCYLLPLMLGISCGDSPNKIKSDIEKSNLEEDTAKESTNVKTILFFGNSLTAGMGLEPDKAFPGIIQEKIDSLSLPFRVINAGLSGETTASGENRIDWLMNQEVDIFVLELGANDGLRGIPLSETRKNLQAIINAVKVKNPETKIVLAGMQIPPNMGQDYTSEFRRIFPELAAENEAYLIPFLLENVAGIPELNQADGIHPTEEGQRIVAQNVWNIIRPIL